MAHDLAALRALAAALPAPIALAGPDGRATLNRAAQELLGLPAAVALDALPGAQAARRALRGERPPAEPVDWVAGGSERPILVHWAPLAEAGPAAAVGMALDAGPVVAREREAIRRADEFYGAVAHELRTPLTPILGWVRMLLHQRPDDPVLVRAAEVIERNVRLQARLVDEMLDVTRISRGTLALLPRRFDLRDACRAAVSRVSAGLGARALTLDQRHADEPLWVEADVGRVEQILETLVGNAVKYTADGGRVEVATARDGDEARCTVSDSGVGLAARDIARVFELPAGGQSPHRSEGGLGVALAIARHLADAQGGSLSAASEGPGRGSTFTLRLPYRKVA